MAARFAFLDHPGPIPFAHRGGAAEAPENTAASFAHALSLGYRYLETDVRATSDGVVAVFHDHVLDRLSDRTGAVEALRWAEVARARVAGDQAVPRLDELLERWPEARWNIDAKHDAVVEPLAEVVRRAGAVERVCLTSFSDRRIARLRAALGPQLCTGMGPGALAWLRLTCNRLAAGRGQRRPAAYGAAQVPLRWNHLPVLDQALVTGAHGRGLAVHAWTIDDEATMDRLLDLGVDGLMTDRPALLRSVLERRGLWVG